MSFTVDDRVLALAGIAQALQQVRRIADTGHSDAAAVRTAVDSVFRVDASSPQEVFGDRHALKSGLRLLHNYFRSQGPPPSPTPPPRAGPRPRSCPSWPCRCCSWSAASFRMAPP